MPPLLSTSFEGLAAGVKGLGFSVIKIRFVGGSEISGATLIEYLGRVLPEPERCVRIIIFEQK